MNKKNISDLLAERNNIEPKLAEQLVKDLFLIIEENLHRQEKTMITRFGKFEARVSPATRRRNPINGEMIEVPEKVSIFFSACKQLRQKINN